MDKYVSKTLTTVVPEDGTFDDIIEKLCGGQMNGAECTCDMTDPCSMWEWNPACLVHSLQVETRSYTTMRLIWSKMRTDAPPTYDEWVLNVIPGRTLIVGDHVTPYPV